MILADVTIKVREDSRMHRKSRRRSQLTNLPVTKVWTKGRDMRTLFPLSSGVILWENSSFGPCVWYCIIFRPLIFLF